MIEEVKKMLEKQRKEILFMERQFEKFEALTEKRMELLRTIKKRHPTSISELADFLDRDIKNVFDDLRLLNKLDIIKFVRIGKRKRPVIKRRVIVISLE